MEINIPIYADIPDERELVISNETGSDDGFIDFTIDGVEVFAISAAELYLAAKTFYEEQAIKQQNHIYFKQQQN